MIIFSMIYSPFGDIAVRITSSIGRHSCLFSQDLEECGSQALIFHLELEYIRQGFYQVKYLVVTFCLIYEDRMMLSIVII